MLTPQHKHYCNCGSCNYLGAFKYEDREYDLYYCLTEGKYPALYVRWGNEASEVEGMPANHPGFPSYLNGNVREAMFQARRQAMMQGFID